MKLRIAFLYLSLATLATAGWAQAVEKIRIDPTSRLYRGAQDGRVYMFHGLDTENSSPPWYLRTLDDRQIALMKTVRIVLHSPECIYACKNNC